MTRHTYEIRVIGSLNAGACEAFSGMLVEVGPAMTICPVTLTRAACTRC